MKDVWLISETSWISTGAIQQGELRIELKFPEFLSFALSQASHIDACFFQVFAWLLFHVHNLGLW